MADNLNQAPYHNHDHSYVWNEDLVLALTARHQQAWQQQRSSQYQWKRGADAIEQIRKDIRRTKTGKIFNLDAKALPGKRVYEECVKIIEGEAPLLPPGFEPLSEAQVAHVQDNTAMPYIQKMKKESGAFAILLAFRVSGRDSLSKQEIIQLGQPFCSSEMEANFHAGRMYGAWKGKDTLVQHGLITEHKAGARFTPNGFRSNGKNTYSISPDGKRAIQQICEKWPDVGDRVERGAPVGGGGGGPTPTHTMPTPTHAHTSLPRKKSAKSTQDEQELKQWINDSTAGQQRVFKGIGKDRRHYLHKLCDLLQEQYSQLVLNHQSEQQGNGVKRDLFITLVQKPTNGLDVGTTVTASPPKAATRKRSRTITPSTGNGHRVGGTSKKPRSANQAAASAALARLEQSTGSNYPPVSIFEHPIVELQESDDEEDDRKPAAKPNNLARTAATTTTTTIKPRNPRDYQPGDDCIVKSSGITAQVSRVHVDGHLTLILPDGTETRLSVREIDPCPHAVAHHEAQEENEKLKSSNVSNSPLAAHPTKQQASFSNVAKAATNTDAAIVDLYLEEDDDSSCASTPVAVTKKAPPVAASAKKPQAPTKNSESKLIILIDDRERSRNHKPRELRIELTKELESFQMEWRNGIVPVTTVEERKLNYGDFAFLEMNDNGEGKGRLSVVVERKRVADLVQRSAYGDHWKQLLRMRDSCQQAIMLIENDTKFAARFDAYGSQTSEQRPGHHTIESDADIFLFIGRAILLSPRIKFVQTKDARATFRSIGAIGLIAQSSDRVERNAPAKATFSSTEQKRLSDILISGGVHWKLANEVAFQFGSTAALESAYDACPSISTKHALVEPTLKSAEGRINCPGNGQEWSRAIFCAFQASPDVRAAKKQSFENLQGIVGNCDPGVLLWNLYRENEPDAALNSAMDYAVVPDTLNRRIVNIKISKEFGPCFEAATESSFYSLTPADPDPRGSLLSCQLSTSSDKFYSGTLTIFLLEGSQMVEEVSEVLQGSPSLVQSAKSMAVKYHNQCGKNSNNDSNNRRILLVRGLGPALDKAAKSASYPAEMPAVCEMVFAELMFEHDIVVLQAVRKKQEETTMILRQLALACYHYQLLHYERLPETITID